MMWSLGTDAGTWDAVFSVTGGALQNGSIPAAARRGLEGLAFSSCRGGVSIAPLSSGFDLVARLEHPEADPARAQHQGRGHGDTGRQRAFRAADEAVTESVDQVEDRVVL